MPFPASKYSRYKRATAFSLDWLLRARGRGHSSGQRLRLSTLNVVVQEIAANISSLTPKLLQELPKALAACQCAITLREHVATFFAEDDEGQRSHQHFLQLLKGWHQTLMRADAQPEDEDALLELESTKLAMEEESGKDFAEDLKLEMVYFFMELDELMEGVRKVFAEVKTEKRSLVEATVVATLAIDIASALTAQVQLKYPTPRTAEQMFNIVRFSAPEKFRLWLQGVHLKYLDDLKANAMNGSSIPPPAPGMFLADFMVTGSTLNSFTTVIPTDPKINITLQEGAFGEIYGEDAAQLELLYNTLVDLRVAGYKPFRPMEAFLVLMDKYFTTRVITVPVVFACICWVKSVGCLQGQRGLGRNTSIAIRHSKPLLDSVEATQAKKAVLEIANVLLEKCWAKTKQDEQFHHLARANPLYAGHTLLNHHLEYMQMSSAILLSTGRFRAFGHLYNALVKERYLERIPFFDDILDIYDEVMFTPSRDSAKPSMYYRTYLMSDQVRASALDAIYSGKALLRGREGYRKRKESIAGSGILSDMSKIYRLMIEDDKSFLKHSSWASMLDHAAQTCSEEMFQTRILSRDLLKLSNSLTDVFNEMCDALDQRDCYEEIIAAPRSGSVMKFTMPFFDALRPNGTIDMSQIPGEFPPNATMNPFVVRGLCQSVAAVIKARYATPPLICNEKFFTFPARPDFVSQEYGTAPISESTMGPCHREKFAILMAKMRDTKGALPDNFLRYMKQAIKEDPSLLRAGVKSGELRTLFHQAAAGPAHNAELLPNAMTLHCAAAAGYDDIVRIILEADHKYDLNTLTFDTKETLAHLAVKNGHENVLNVLRQFGADLRVRDGAGRRVCDVTSDPNWARKLAKDASGYFDDSTDGDKRRNALLHRQSKQPARPLNVESDLGAKERQKECEKAVGTGSTGKKTKSKKKQKQKKKKKGKKTKKKDESDIGDATKESIIAAAATATMDPGAGETSLFLKHLLKMAGSDINQDADPEAVPQLESMLNSMVVAMFSRLRDPTIPASEKVGDVEHASSFAVALMGFVSSYSNKFCRVDHAAVTAPELDPVRVLWDITPEFSKFVLRTTQIGASIDRKPQAREILDLLEKRLLKVPFEEREPMGYRGIWYISTHVDDPKIEAAVDRLNGHPFYFDLVTTSSPAFEKLKLAVTAVLNGVVCFGGNGAVQAVDKKLHCFYQYYATVIRRSSQDSHLAHTNPIVAGLMMLDRHFEYLDLASELIVVTSKLHFFGHLYNALVVEGFLPRLPFVEEILNIYEKMIFTPSRAAATRGAYYRTYLLSSSLKATALDAALRDDRTNNGSVKTKRRPVFFLKDVSKIFRLMTKGDTSFLRAGTSKALLTMATHICTEELFKTRVLSRDMLILHNDLTDIFSEMCNVLGEIETRSVNDGQFVMLTVIRVLDAMQSNGEAVMSAVPGGNSNPWLGDRVDGGRFRAICTELAEVIKSKFAIAPADLERRYCVLSSFFDIEKADEGASSKMHTATPVAGQAEQVERATDSLRRIAAAVFTRLRYTSIPVHCKAEDAHHASKLMERLQGLVADFSAPDQITGSSTRMRNLLFSEASRVIYLMQRFHRTDHPAVTVPALTPVRELCDTSPSLTNFVVNTARIDVSVNKKSQAQDLLELLEKRLFVLKRLHKVILLDFRVLVQTYSKAREDMGLGKTSSPDTLRALEWFLTDMSDDYELQKTMDEMDGQLFYFDLVTTGAQDATELEDMLGPIPGFVCYGERIKHVVFGGPRDEVTIGRKVVVALAENIGVQFSERNSLYCANSLRVGESVFSADGVVRDTTSR
ncbi:hypothetical protein PHYSODRAFT_331096 [Phytophthora sojae]|uniref:DUF6604 domain-containing protein n=1 Tax=Phytophthora sojae (strain P6497) TaxID=1094619 RepID=G4ZG12_PHYSP|nr:hypothetical protein PHYSODRAFT_331096 [Phytophthora sojae]EGZ17079.1 hypothetical protein PHYSODRAFT_331096 [Phytophthora sojae]|eukprot:XP_009526137.1 hypothetical protein PHYSODRAFT_331096 [Phytophthora sojae]